MSAVGCHLHHVVLQAPLGAVATTHSIDAHGDHGPELFVDTQRDFPRQAVDLTGGHRVGHIDVNGADVGVGAIVVHDDVVDAQHLVEAHHLALQFGHEFAWHMASQQLVDGRGQHLKAGLKDNQRDQDAEPSVEVHLPEQHDDGRDQRGERDDGIEEGVGTACYQCVAPQFVARAPDVSAQQNLHHDGYDDDHQHYRVVLRQGGVQNLLD